MERGAAVVKRAPIERLIDEEVVLCTGRCTGRCTSTHHHSSSAYYCLPPSDQTQSTSTSTPPHYHHYHHHHHYHHYPIPSHPSTYPGLDTHPYLAKVPSHPFQQRKIQTTHPIANRPSARKHICTASTSTVQGYSICTYGTTTRLLIILSSPLVDSDDEGLPRSSHGMYGVHNLTAYCTVRKRTQTRVEAEGV